MAIAPIRKPEMLWFLRQHDFVYDEAPLTWEEGLPIGNGSLGTVIWGDGNPLKLTFDSYELWDQRARPFEDPRYSYKRFKELYREGRIGEVSDLFAFRRDEVVPTRLP